MPFEVVSGVGRGMGVLDGGSDRRSRRGNFGAEFWASYCNWWGLCRVFVRERRALPKLHWKDLFVSLIKSGKFGRATHTELISACDRINEDRFVNSRKTKLNSSSPDMMIIGSCVERWMILFHNLAAGSPFLEKLG